MDPIYSNITFYCFYSLNFIKQRQAISNSLDIDINFDKDNE